MSEWLQIRTIIQERTPEDRPVRGALEAGILAEYSCYGEQRWVHWYRWSLWRRVWNWHCGHSMQPARVDYHPNGHVAVTCTAAFRVVVCLHCGYVKRVV